jgi:hypothetical protein
MAVKKYNEVVIKSVFYLPTQITPEHSIDEIISGIKALGGKPTITGTKLVDEMPK